MQGTSVRRPASSEATAVNGTWAFRLGTLTAGVTMALATMAGTANAASAASPYGATISTGTSGVAGASALAGLPQVAGLHRPAPGPPREVRGAPVDPTPQTLVQPDGTSFRAVQHGDAVRSWWTAAGATIARTAGGTWRFATALDASGQPAAVGAAVSPVAAAPAAAVGLSPTENAVVPQTDPATPSLGFTGQQNTLVILAQFSDRHSVGTTPADWHARFFGATGSVRAFYRGASSGTLDLTPATETSGTPNDGVIGWVDLGTNHPNYYNKIDSRAQDVTTMAIEAADPYIDYASYDTSRNGVIEPAELHLTVIAAGYEGAYGGSSSCTPNVWGHRWAIDNGAPVVDGVTVGSRGYTQFGESHCDKRIPLGAHQATIGIMAHELGHDLGWPDLYDTDGSSEGVGEWSLMASGSWGTKSNSSTPGDAPVLPDAWSRSVQGWVAPVEVTATTNAALSQVSTTDTVYRMLSDPNGPEYSKTGVGEYFLVENRQKAGLDTALPGCGLLVYHVHEGRTSNATDADRLVDVVEADGLEGLNKTGYRGGPGDAWHGVSGHTVLTTWTSPSTRRTNGTATTAQMSAKGGCAATMSATLTGDWATAPSDVKSGFTAVSPVRVLDTRTGVGAPKAKVGGGRAISVIIPGLPAGATAVTMNVTATHPTSTSYVSVYPGGTARPGASNLNVVAGQTIPNLVTVALGAGNRVTLYNASGTIDLIADLAGYYRRDAGAGFTAVSPVRVLDTRTGVGAPKAKVGGGRAISVIIPGLPAGATAVTMNVTATHPTSTSYVSVYPGGTARPGASNLNVVAGQTIPNLVTVALGAGNRVTLYNASGTIDLIADLAGYYRRDAGAGFTAVSPVRVLDTRTGVGAPKAKVGGGRAISVIIPGLPAGATAVTMNVTATHPTSTSYVSVYPGGTARPGASNLNVVAGQTIPNLVTVALGAGNRVTLYNASGTIDLIADLAGYHTQ